MLPKLGLVCMTTTDEVRFRTVTRTSLHKHDEAGQRRLLLELYRDNAAGTWADPSLQLTHISNGREGFNDRRHSDFISVMPACYREAPWIEVEAKAKEQAVARLRDMGW